MKALPFALLSLLLLGGCRAKTDTSGASKAPIDPFASAPSSPSSPSAPSARGGAKPEKGKLAKGSVQEVRVVGVSDGDTVKVLTADRKEVTVRLNGIDAPEKKQAFGTQAKTRLSDLVFDKTVTVKVEDIDRYGRAVGQITLGGQSVNQRMVRDGMAWWYRAYAKKDRDLERFEAEAKAARRGLWAGRSAEAPWEWRKARRSAGAR